MMVLMAFESLNYGILLGFEENFRGIELLVWQNHFLILQFTQIPEPIRVQEIFKFSTDLLHTLYIGSKPSINKSMVKAFQKIQQYHLKILNSKAKM